MFGVNRKKGSLSQPIFKDEAHRINHFNDVSYIFRQTSRSFLTKKYWTRLNRELEIASGHSKSFGDGLSRTCPIFTDEDTNQIYFDA